MTPRDPDSCECPICALVASLPPEARQVTEDGLFEVVRLDDPAFLARLDEAFRAAGGTVAPSRNARRRRAAKRRSR